MKTLFLKLVDLPDPDVRQIEVFLRFAGRTADFQWTCTAGNLVDLQLQGVRPQAASFDDVNAAFDASIRRVWILDRGQPVPDSDSYVLRRPLQVDGFEALLRTRELEIARRLAAIRTDAAAALAVSASARGTASPRLFVDDPRTSYRLLKWPGTELLRGRPKFVRMLGFLSSRPLTMKRLMVLSGVDEAACRDLLALLDQRRLLVRTRSELDLDASASVAEILDTGPESAAVARPRDSANAGLFSRLRKRLGLG